METEQQRPFNLLNAQSQGPPTSGDEHASNLILTRRCSYNKDWNNLLYLSCLREENRPLGITAHKENMSMRELFVNGEFRIIFRVGAGGKLQETSPNETLYQKGTVWT